MRKRSKIKEINKGNVRRALQTKDRNGVKRILYIFGTILKKNNLKKKANHAQLKIERLEENRILKLNKGLGKNEK